MIEREVRAAEKQLHHKLVAVVRRAGPQAVIEESNVDVWIRNSLIGIHQELRRMQKDIDDLRPRSYAGEGRDAK